MSNNKTDKPMSLQNMVEVQNNLSRESASSAIRSIVSDIKKSTPKAVMPEQVFVDYFLDFMQNPSNYPDSNLLYKFIEYAGGPYNEIDIIDNNGNIIYSTPGAFPLCVMDYEKTSGYDFINIVSTYNKKKKITDAVANNYLTTALSNLDKLVATNIAEFVIRWTNIFNRYNVDANNKQSGLSKTSVDENIFDM